ncbi:superinfection exclusion B family protein [Clostridium sp. FAM 1755]|uniref:superinfection exclusion B family protein n=1 Tax=Clostridium caseinilyticum TaxID=3350403 RepID=UPI0038F6008A
MDFNFTELLKLPASIMSAISLASGVILFLPDSIINKLYMIDFRNRYGFVIGAVFIISTSILTIGVITKSYKFLNSKYSNKKVKRNSKKLLVSLDTYKKTIVYMLYQEENNTHTLPLNDGAVVFLEHWMVIQKATTQYFTNDFRNPQFPYFLQPWVIDALKKDDKLLLSFEKASEKQANKIQSSNLYVENE